MSLRLNYWVTSGICRSPADDSPQFTREADISVSQSACTAHVNCGRGAVRTGTHVIRRLLLGKHARRMTAFSDARLSENTRVPDMELDHWVTWVIFHVRVTGSSFWTGMRPEFFQFFEKLPKMQNVHLKCWNDKSHCQVSVVWLKSLDVSPCNELLLLPVIIKNYLAWYYFFAHKSTFGVHCRTGSPGQLGLWVAGFPGHWVAGPMWPSSISVEYRHATHGDMYNIAIATLWSEALPVKPKPRYPPRGWVKKVSCCTVIDISKARQ